MQSSNNQLLAHQFLHFLVDSFTLMKKKSGSPNTFKSTSLAFQTLYVLKKHETDALTMSLLASTLDIPKQQLSKLVNDLESKHYVKRTHDLKNRRLVYIQITEYGKDTLEELSNGIIAQLTEDIKVYTSEEKKDIHECLTKLTLYLKKLI